MSDFFIKIRDIVMANKKPRRLDVNNNLVRYNEKSVEPATYPENFEGIILSYADRYRFTEGLFNQVTTSWNEHKTSMRV